ncbi:MAG: hypothetical protein H0V54_04830 [Chthoniobacterales bacterium]|nr:hypothetical protein [Chthoniobacterales bacterium]
MKLLLTSILLVVASLNTASGQCPIAPERKPFVEEIVGKLVFDLVFVADNVHGSERGFALTLFGVDSGTLGQVLLAFPCTARTLYEPTIERRDDGSYQRSQLSCEAAGVGVIRLDITSDKSSHMLTYPATRYQGTVLFDPNPRADWRTVEHADGSFSINAGIARHLIFTPTAGEAVDLTHSASLTGRVVNGTPVAANADVILPAVTNNARPLVAHVRVDEAGNATGTVEVDGTSIATITGPGFELSFAWSTDCAALSR